MDKKRLTAENGRPIADNQNVQTAGRPGPFTAQDPWYLEKIAHFDREVIPERRMHAKGSGAFGTFTVTEDITEFTRASSPKIPVSCRITHSRTRIALYRMVQIGKFKRIT